MSFDGDSFYSYGTVIAKRLRVGGRLAWLLNETSYSVTTSKHQSWVRRAIPDVDPQFTVSGIRRGENSAIPTKPRQLGALIFDQSLKRAAAAQARAPRCRSEWSKNAAASDESSALAMAKQASEFFGLRRKVDADAVTRLAKRVAADLARRKKADAAEQARRESELAERIEQWMAGADVQFPYSIARVCLRAVDGEMQTSKGARVPLTEAERAFRFVIACRAKGWHRNGTEFAVGSYQLDAVNDRGVVAGCHRVSWEEIERFAQAQGWTT